MKEEIGKNRRSILAPLAVGGLVGAGLALFLAPKSGKELREDIRTVVGNTRTRIRATVEKGKELYTGGVTVVKDAVGAGKESYQREVEKHRQAA